MNKIEYQVASTKLTMDWRKSLLDTCNLLYQRTEGAAPSLESIREAQYHFDAAKLDWEFAQAGGTP